MAVEPVFEVSVTGETSDPRGSIPGWLVEVFDRTILYPITGDPPVVVGAFHESVTWLFPPMALIGILRACSDAL